MPTHDKRPPFTLIGGSAVLGSSRRSHDSSAEEARTRGFATPAFAGCAFCYVVAATIPYRAILTPSIRVTPHLAGTTSCLIAVGPPIARRSARPSGPIRDY